MNYIFAALSESIRDKWPLIFSGILCAGILCFAYGCEPTARSIINPNMKFTRLELEAEIKNITQIYSLRIKDIEKQEQFRQTIFNQILITAETGTINPIGVLTSVLAILGIGAAGDDVRLRRQRKKRLYLEPNVTNPD